MKQSTSLQHLRALRFTLQKMRGQMQDAHDLPEQEMAEFMPWFFGKKCPLITLDSVINDADSGKDLTTNNYCNLIYLCMRFIPTLYASAQVHVSVAMGKKLSWPEAEDLADIRRHGWESAQ